MYNYNRHRRHSPEMTPQNLQRGPLLVPHDIYTLTNKVLSVYYLQGHDGNKG